MTRSAVFVLALAIDIAGCARTTIPGVVPPSSSAYASAALHGGTAYDVLFDFDEHDGGDPEARLLAIDGSFYGTTVSGGRYGRGTLFKVTASGVETVLYDFLGKDDGAFPHSSLVVVDGRLYGTTSQGGTGDQGTVFSASTDGNEHVVYSFGASGSSDGATPAAGLTLRGRTLYGTTFAGGANDAGTVFSVDTLGKERVVYSFAGGDDGANPAAGVTVAMGALYGTTSAGGGKGCYADFGCGTVFMVDSTGRERTLYRFRSWRDGAVPSSLVFAGGTLYGTTYEGGRGACVSAYGTKTGCGTVFSITTSGKKDLLHSFEACANCGVYPEGGVIDVKGTLYGTTLAGGNDACFLIVSQIGGCGTVFGVSERGKSSKVLYRFQGPPDGEYPQAGLTALKGVLYGTTANGGTTGNGTIFRLSL